MASLAGVLLEAERRFLGFERTPPELFLEREGWRPDSPGRYCCRCGRSLSPPRSFDSPCVVGRSSHEGVVRAAYEGVLADCPARSSSSGGRQVVGRLAYFSVGRCAMRSNRTIGFVVRSSFRLRCLSVDVWFEESTIHAVSPGPWEKCSVARFCNRFVSPLVARNPSVPRLSVAAAGIHFVRECSRTGFRIVPSCWSMTSPRRVRPCGMRSGASKRLEQGRSCSPSGRSPRFPRYARARWCSSLSVDIPCVARM